MKHKVEERMIVPRLNYRSVPLFSRSDGDSQPMDNQWGVYVCLRGVGKQPQTAEKVHNLIIVRRVKDLDSNDAK